MFYTNINSMFELINLIYAALLCPYIRAQGSFMQMQIRQSSTCKEGQDILYTVDRWSGFDLQPCVLSLLVGGWTQILFPYGPTALENNVCYVPELQ